MHIVASSRPPLDYLEQLLERRLAYPRPGVDGGGGRHASPAESTTTAESFVLQHPTLPQFAYFVSSRVAAHLAELQAAAQARIAGGTGTALDQALVALSAPTTLDATWQPKTAVDP